MLGIRSRHRWCIGSQAPLTPGTHKLGNLGRSGDPSSPQLPISLRVSLPQGIPSPVPPIDSVSPSYAHTELPPLPGTSFIALMQSKLINHDISCGQILSFWKESKLHEDPD